MAAPAPTLVRRTPVPESRQQERRAAPRPASAPAAAPRPAPAPASSPWSVRPADRRPVAAVRLPGRRLAATRDALRDAGFEVHDILRRETGPAPCVLVLELPASGEDAARLLEAGARGPGRVLLVTDRGQVPPAARRAGLDEVVERDCHPLQVAGAALRVSGAPEWLIARWCGSAFEELPAR